MWRKLAQLLRAGIAGLAATGADLATLALCVSVLHVDPRLASLPDRGPVGPAGVDYQQGAVHV